MWLGRLDSNQGMAVPKTAALPLGYAPMRRERPYNSVFEKHNRAERSAAGFEQPVPARRIPLGYSPQTASSLPAGSRKWNRLPPGKEKIGLTILPPADSTSASVASRSSE